MSHPSLPSEHRPHAVRGAVYASVLAIALAAAGFAATADAAPKSSKGRDSTPPQTSITAQPPATTTQTSASFTISSNEPATFECKMDGAAFAACGSPKTYASLAVGTHVFQVRAKDQAGNVDATPASYTWQITTPVAALPSGVVTVPSSIPADCSSNVQEQIAGFINAQPDGSTINFPPNGCYAQNDRIVVHEKRNLTIDAHGSTFKSSAENSGCVLKPNWLLLRGENVRMRNFKIVGNFNPPAGTERGQAYAVSAATSCANGNQFNMGIGIYGGKTIYVTDSDIKQVYGDGIATAQGWYISGYASDPRNTPTDVHIERVTVTTTARHSFAPTSTDGFWLEDSKAVDSYYGGVDAELDSNDQVLRDVHILRNTFAGVAMFHIAVPVAGSRAVRPTNTDGFEIRHNVFKDSPGPQAYCNQSILFGMYPDEPYTFSNVVIDNNTFEDRTGWGVDLNRVTSGSVQHNKDVYRERNCNWPNGPAPFYSTKAYTSGVTVADNTPTSAGATTS